MTDIARVDKPRLQFLLLGFFAGALVAWLASSSPDASLRQLEESMKRLEESVNNKPADVVAPVATLAAPPLAAPAATPTASRALRDIFKDAGTDKYSTHGYYRAYERVLEPIRHRAGISFLEIGVESGRSMASWSEYFSEPRVLAGVSYGNDQVEEKRQEGVQVFYKGSQDDAALLARLCSEQGPFDAVIDDGSHHPQHQVYTFSQLIACVKPGGLYMVEDIETSYWNRPGVGLYGYRMDQGGLGRAGSAVEQFKRVADVVNRKYMLNPTYSVIPNDHLVRSVAFEQNLIIMRTMTPEDKKFFEAGYMFGAHVIKQPNENCSVALKGEMPIEPLKQ